MHDKSPDPQLQAAASEIKAILRKYDCGAIIALASGNGKAEYVNFITEPSWSCLTTENLPNGVAIRLRSRASSAPAEERFLERSRLQKTVNMIFIFMDVLAMQFDTMKRLRLKIDASMLVEEERGVHIPAMEEK